MVTNAMPRNYDGSIIDRTYDPRADPYLAEKLGPGETIVRLDGRRPYHPDGERRVNSSYVEDLIAKNALQRGEPAPPPIAASDDPPAGYDPIAHALQLQAERDRIERDQRNSRDRAKRLRNRHQLIQDGTQRFRGPRPKGAG